MQQRQRNVQKSVIHVQSCCFAYGGSAVLVAFAVKGVSFQSCARSLCCIKLELNLDRQLRVNRVKILNGSV